MAQQTINVGAAPNDGTGTPLRTAFQYTNSNFTELYTAVGPSGNNIVVPGTATITGDLTVDTSTLKVDSANNRVGVGTASPGFALDVQSATGTVIRTKGGSGSGQGSALYVTAAGSTSTFFAVGDRANIFGGTPDVTASIYTAPSIPLTFDVGGSTAMTLNSTGLGIGGPAVSRLTLGADTNTDGSNKFTFYRGGTSGQYSVIENTGGTVYRSYGTGGHFFYINNGTTEAVRVDTSGNVGIGVATSAWSSIYKVSQIGQSASVSGGTSVELAVFGSNCYFDATDSRWERITSGFTSQYYQTNSTHVWRIGGTAGANTDCAFTPAMTLDASGNLLVGTTVVSGTINGAGSITAKGVAGITMQTVTALATNYALPIGSFAGLIVIRSNGGGGSAVFMLDPNVGAVSISNNIVGRTITLTYSGGAWQFQQTVGAVPSTYNYLVLATQ